jgi:hypothetical protein
VPITWTTPDAAAAICGADPADMAGPVELASLLLYQLTGRQWPGPQADVVRPCTPLRHVPASGAYAPVGGAAAWATVGSWCGCASPQLCGCNTPGTVTLPGDPALSVERVTLDAVVLPPEAYRLMGQLLVRVDGRAWPCCQDWRVPGDQPGAFEVAYTWGAEPDSSGQYVAGVLACELHKAQAGDGACRLPKRVTTVSRQGVNIALLDPLAMFPEGQTGIPEVDLWLSAQRWGHTHRPATVLVPGARQRNLRDTAAP